MNSSKRKHVSRRGFIRSASYAAAVAGLGRMPSLKAMGYKSPNEKLNIAGIGAGGQAFQDLKNAHAGTENIVALADVYDALTNKRPYKAAFDHEIAKSIILERQHHFDPFVLRAFLDEEDRLLGVRDTFADGGLPASPLLDHLVCH